MYREPFYDERDVEDGGDAYYYTSDEDDDDDEVQENTCDFETVAWQPPQRKGVR